MLVRIETSKHVWTSPDGRVKIYDFEGRLPDGEQIVASTRSDKIAQAINQTLDLTTTVSTSGKTYYIQVPRDDTRGVPSPQSSSSSKVVQSTSLDSERLTQVLDRLTMAVDRLAGVYPVNNIEDRRDISGQSEITLDDELSPELDDYLQTNIDILDREMADRIDDSE